MDSGIASALIAALAFAATFGIVRVVTRLRSKRKAVQQQAEVLKNQSRQVRRAQARRNKT